MTVKDNAAGQNTSVTTELEDGTQVVLTHNPANVLQSIVQWQPKNVELIYGLELSPDIPEEQFRAIRRYTDQYTKAQCQPVDTYLNRTLTVCGCMMHPATVRFSDSKKAPVIDASTGEVVEYESKYRQVIRVSAIDNKALPNPIYISFISMAIEQEFKDTFIPRYGPGDWNTTLDIVVERIRTRSGGNTYNMRYV
ncbi:MAG: hypothetical protein ACRETA_04420 [Gammaproteobacteria bacterium]